eukprot:superscaffoldBa00002770_g15241
MHECIMDPDYGAVAGGEAMAAPMVQRCTVAAGWCDPTPPGDRPVVVDISPEQDCLERLGLIPAVICTIQWARAPSTMACHTGAWREAQIPHRVLCLEC